MWVGDLEIGSVNICQIKGEQSTNVACHFNSRHGGNLSFVQVQIIEKVKTPWKGGDIFRRLCKREVFWIFKLRSRIPEGMNYEWDVTHYHINVFSIYMKKLFQLCSPSWPCSVCGNCVKRKRKYSTFPVLFRFLFHFFRLQYVSMSPRQRTVR